MLNNFQGHEQMEMSLLKNKADVFQVWKCLIILSCCEEILDLTVYFHMNCLVSCSSFCVVVVFISLLKLQAACCRCR